VKRSLFRLLIAAMAPLLRGALEIGFGGGLLGR